MRGTAWSAFTGYLALSTTLPTDAGGNVTEPSDGYARQAITWNAPTDGDGTAAEIVFSPSAAWNSISYALIYDAVSGGNLISWVAITPVDVTGAGTLTFAATTGLTFTAA